MKNFTQLFRAKGRWMFEMSVLVLVFAMFTVFMINNMRIHGANLAGRDFSWKTLLIWVGLFFGNVPVFYLIYQAVLICFYKPVVRENVSDEELPTVSVIVPAYNESSNVADSLRSLLECDYPKDKLEIIAVNDGSLDDTLNWMNLVAGSSDGLIRVIDLGVNQGKRHALYAGFHAAKNEIVVTIDSDSIVRSDTIRNLVLPFENPEVGGVAGAVRVRNIHRGFVPRVLDICFVFGSDFMRSAQGAIGAVLCSPGAISGYRKAAMLPHLDDWVEQRFMGRLSKIGEDRALTSILLRNNYKVMLQKNAVIETDVPTSYSQLCKTLIRWTRGDIREGLLLVRYFAGKFRLGDWRLSMMKINIFCQLVGLLLPALLIPGIVFTLFSNSGNFFFMLGYMIFSTWLWAMLPAVLYAHRESPSKAIWAFINAIFSLFGLSWICIYSWLTMGNPGWLTREMPKKEEKIEVRGAHGNF